MVSVVIPFYKNINFLDLSLHSLCNQTYKDFEVILVNDGSKENLSLILKKYLSKLDLTVINQSNQGAASARNSGIKKAKGNYIAFLDSDDLWIPNKLEIQIGFMIKNGLSWSHHNYHLFKTNTNQIIKSSKLNNLQGYVTQKILRSFRAQTSTFMVKKDVFEDNSNFFPEKRFFGQDVYFYLKLSLKYKLGFINQYLSFFRIHGENKGFDIKNNIRIRSIIYEDFIVNNNIKVKKIIFWVYQYCNRLYLTRIKSKILLKILYLPIYIILKIV